MYFLSHNHGLSLEVAPDRRSGEDRRAPTETVEQERPPGHHDPHLDRLTREYVEERVKRETVEPVGYEARWRALRKVGVAEFGEYEGQALLKAMRDIEAKIPVGPPIGDEDIVERLLSAVSVIESAITGAPIPIGSKDLQDAADEIRRLRSQLKAAIEYGSADKSVLKRELARLRSQEPVGYVVRSKDENRGWIDKVYHTPPLWAVSAPDTFTVHPIGPPVEDES